jgi:hypothetical protein
MRVRALVASIALRALVFSRKYLIPAYLILEALSADTRPLRSSGSERDRSGTTCEMRSMKQVMERIARRELASA